MLSITLLGPPRVLRDQRPLAITRRQSRALVYYLAAHSAPVTREHLLTLLWADHERPAAQQVLRTILHGLRKTLGPALLTDDDTLALAPDIDIDVRRFRAHLSPPVADTRLLTATLELYHGDFLADFTLPTNAAFDDWVLAERERYRHLAVRGFTALAQRHEANQEFAAALDALTRAIAFDPLQEDLQRTCMRLHYQAGDRAGAIRRYEELRRLLDEEMGVPPMAETRALYDAIITDTLEPDKETRRHGDTETGARGQGSGVRGLPPSVPPPAGGGRGAGVDERTTQNSKLKTQNSSPSQLPFVGRAAELEALRAQAAVRQLVLVEGEPGIGKTRLVAEYIRAADALALTGRARELERALPYQPVIEALRGLLAHPDWPTLEANLDLPAVWLAELARLLPELAASLPDPRLAQRAADESRLWEGLNQFLIALARRRPVVLFLDDLHWADASTLALLGYLARQVAPAPVAYLTTAHLIAPRSPLAALLQTLTRDGRLARLPLARLTPSDTTILARHFSLAYQYPLAEWLTRNAEGNPYILAELIRYARDYGLLSADGTLNLTALSHSPVVPQTVYNLILARVAQLSDAARRVLDAAVAAGREFEFEIVARAAALSEDAALDALDELRRATLVYPLDGSRYAFDHTLTMEVAYREVGEPRHRLLHRRVAEALESIHRQDLDATAGLLASHFAEGNAPERAALYAFRAGQLASGLAAWNEASAFYEQALAGADEARRATILMALGQARFQAGAFPQASEAFRSALAQVDVRSDSAARAATRLALARSLLPQARYAELMALIREMRADADRPEDLVQVELLWGTTLSLEGADLAGAAEHLHSAAALCAAQADPASLAQIRFELGSVAAQQGDLHQAIALYREALDAARSADSEATLNWQILAHNNLAYHLHLLGDPAAAEHAQAGLRLAREKGMLPLLPYLLSTSGEIALAGGDLATAEGYFAEGLALAEQLSSQERVAGLTANLGLVALRRGQSALAIHRLSSALGQADALGTRHLAAQIRLWLVPLLPPAEARAHLAEARAIAESGGRLRLLAEVERLELLNVE